MGLRALLKRLAGFHDGGVFTAGPSEHGTPTLRPGEVVVNINKAREEFERMAKGSMRVPPHMLGKREKPGILIINNARKKS